MHKTTTALYSTLYKYASCKFDKKVYYKNIESESFRAKSEEEEYQSALPNP